MAKPVADFYDTNRFVVYQIEWAGGDFNMPKQRALIGMRPGDGIFILQNGPIRSRADYLAKNVYAAYYFTPEGSNEIFRATPPGTYDLVMFVFDTREGAAKFKPRTPLLPAGATYTDLRTPAEKAAEVQVDKLHKSGLTAPQAEAVVGLLGEPPVKRRIKFSNANTDAYIVPVGPWLGGELPVPPVSLSKQVAEWGLYVRDSVPTTYAQHSAASASTNGVYRSGKYGGYQAGPRTIPAGGQLFAYVIASDSPATNPTKFLGPDPGVLPPLPAGYSARALDLDQALQDGLTQRQVRTLLSTQPDPPVEVSTGADYFGPGDIQYIGTWPGGLISPPPVRAGNQNWGYAVYEGAKPLDVKADDRSEVVFVSSGLGTSGPMQAAAGHVYRYSISGTPLPDVPAGVRPFERLPMKALLRGGFTRNQAKLILASL